MSMSPIYKSSIGLVVYYDADSKPNYTITGNVSQKHTVREMESAYDFEELVKKKIQHVGIEFDSEYAQFFAYAKTKDLAIQFVKNCESYFDRVREMLY